MNDAVSSIDRTKIPISQLVLPMFIENIIRTSLLSVDQLMLYAYSEKAVAAMGVVNQMAFFLQLIYLVIGIGVSIQISQNLGANRKTTAGMFGLASLVLIGLFAILLSTATVLLAAPLLQNYCLEKDVEIYAWQFLTIYGGGSIFMALNIVQTNILRSYGYSREPMIANVIALVFNIVGNSFCLFGLFGFPRFGVVGVAMVTVLSQLIILILLGAWILQHKEIDIPFKRIFNIPFALYWKILSIGVPSAGENLSYNIGQIVIVRMIASLGTNALAAYSLAMTLSRYIFISGVSIGMGTQIKVGYYVGSNQHDEAHHRVYRYFAAGFSISTITIILLNIFKYPVIGFFTQNPEIIAMTASALLIGLILEPGRNFNTIIIPGLKGAGDVHFPALMGILFMWGIGVAGAYLLGIHFGLGLIGIWIAMAADEWFRGLVMLLRWKSGQWRKKGLIKKRKRPI